MLKTRVTSFVLLAVRAGEKEPKIMWCLKYECPSDGESDFTLFNSEQDAWQQAVYELQEYIFQALDMSEEEAADAAQQINLYVVLGKYEAAIQHWNDCDFNADDNDPRFWMVYEMDPLVPTNKPRVFSPSYFTALVSDQDDRSESEEEDETPATQTSGGVGTWQALTPGATCRGHHKEWNEYAYADQPDGTYLCHQCKMFQQVFGGIKTS
jgi:hypothetical protein